MASDDYFHIDMARWFDDKESTIVVRPDSITYFGPKYASMFCIDDHLVFAACTVYLSGLKLLNANSINCPEEDLFTINSILSLQELFDLESDSESDDE